MNDQAARLRATDDRAAATPSKQRAAPAPSLLDGRLRLVLAVAMWLAALAVFVLFPGSLSFAASVAIMALFAMSLDIALGVAGIVTLGHALYFGCGAYAAGLLALQGWTEPISNALAAALVAGLLASVLGPFVLRARGLPLIMVTLALGLIAYEAANKATHITGGDNGLNGVELAPLLGTLRWSVYGTVEYGYTLAWLFLMFVLARRLIRSPFGLALRGVQENAGRMALIGAPVLGHLVRAYVISAVMAGVAGALSAQTTKFVGLEVLSINTSVDVLVMLVLGGVGKLYGALVGAVVYMTVHHLASEWNPYHWMFIIGLLLVVVVRFAPGGVLGAGARVVRSLRSRIA